MSDSRFSLKGTFSIYGKNYPLDWSLNWHSQYPDEIDRRITEFFLHAHDEAYQEWRQESAETQTRREIEEIERREKAELERLRAKYGDTPNAKLSHGGDTQPKETK